MYRSKRSFSHTHGHGGGRYRGNQRSSFGRQQRQATFNPTFLVEKAGVKLVKTEYLATHRFDDFAILEQLKKNVLARGYTKPTPIQDQVIEPILGGRDVVGVANTGTGKTAAFLIPLIHRVTIGALARVLIVTPTRELAMQVRDELTAFGNGLGLSSALCIGGAKIQRQIEGLTLGPQFVIGTPGRLKDLEKRRRLDFSDFGAVVLDEVDRMLDMGFIRDVRGMIKRLPSKRQSLFFSATIPDNVREVMQSFLTDPVAISVQSAAAAENVDQEIIRINGKPKLEVLHDLLKTEGFEKVLVFGRTKWGMEKVMRELARRGLRVAAIHGNKSQNQRQRALSEFRDNKIQALLATDVASRGLDIDNVTHVINYDLPATYEDYIHRVGRTGRADKVGKALTFIE
ncbi:MAG: DEAD/DEAH box helicase [Candidatus Chisholmbacteria bacterium]|nr:DEAD/DEAH box helicase [Candidatus Chisholmbacteria bacterium]